MIEDNFLKISKNILRVAGVYNMVWGLVVVLYPNLFFNLAQLPVPAYPQIWQAVGMIVGVYGLGYWWAATNSVVHWPIIAVGFLGKVFGIVGGVGYYLLGELQGLFLVLNLFNDLLWLPFFAFILYQVFRQKQHVFLKKSQQIQWQHATTTNGKILGMLSKETPLLLVFVRHLGCSFCKETLVQLKNNLPAIAKAGVKPVVVHMSCDVPAQKVLNGFGLGEVHHVSDPHAQIYESLNLQRAKFSQVFGYKEWIRGVYLMFFKGIKVGQLQGDGFRLSGAFLVYQGQIQKAYRSKRASDVMPIVELAQEASKCSISA